MGNYSETPNIISGKDLDYLSDIFTWNYGAYKKTINAKNNITNNEIISLFDKAAEIFHNNMNTVLNILNEGGNNEQ